MLGKRTRSPNGPHEVKRLAASGDAYAKPISKPLASLSAQESATPPAQHSCEQNVCMICRSQLTDAPFDGHTHNRTCSVSMGACGCHFHTQCIVKHYTLKS